MMDRGAWIGQIETEIARELGQSVTAGPAAEAPAAENSLTHLLEVPGARLHLTVDRGDAARFLAAARLIDSGQADDAMVSELWTGILASIAARLGGKALGTESGEDLSSNAFSLTVAGVTLAVGLSIEATPAANAHAAEGSRNFDLLLEVELDAAVRFGSRELELRELLALGPGDVVELDRRLSDPVDLIVGDKIVARGEVVLVNGNFGLRVTEVAEPVRRLESIRWLC